MRLIDADKLRKQIHCEYSDDLGILEKIDAQPTAYNTDRVIEELKQESLNVSNDMISDLCYEAVLLKVAIDIVKDGGICQ